MPNFWDNFNINQNNKINNNFNLQEFIKFKNDMNGKDPNQLLQQMINSGQITMEQYEQAKSQANGILQMLKTIGIIK